MHIIKLNATDSTNAYLKSLMFSNALEDYTVVVAKEQLQGRGQMGAIWNSNPGKNLTFSVLKKNKTNLLSLQFSLTMGVSLAIYDALKKINIPDLSIKWPNDILSGHHKICGILIENILSGNILQNSIIGIGLNVNQEVFENLPNASSLKNLTGRSYDLEELLQLMVVEIKQYLSKVMDEERFKQLQALYEGVLFRRNKPATFKGKSGELFMGFIKGVSQEGKLVVALEDHVLEMFDLKEIQLLY